ncbi:MAG TPA: FAD-binding protein [Streptosporangiaceae bacterium]|nr:FAD-binding protein [Streptosporangiaceae bacterium]
MCPSFGVPGHRPFVAAQHHGQPRNHTLRADAGCAWGDVDHATVAFGVATPSGFLAPTGVAGLNLGGGIGYLTRRFGLTVDNLLAGHVVLADGTCVTASESSHPDLFWSLRARRGRTGSLLPDLQGACRRASFPRVVGNRTAWPAHWRGGGATCPRLTR